MNGAILVLGEKVVFVDGDLGMDGVIGRWEFGIGSVEVEVVMRPVGNGVED